MASVLTALGATIVPTSSPVVLPTPVPIIAPTAAPVAAGSLLSGYFVIATYLDSTCSALRYSDSNQLNVCLTNIDLTSYFFTATSTEYIERTYTDSACKSGEVINRYPYQTSCSGSSKTYVSGVPEPPSTAPAVYLRLARLLPFLALTLPCTFATSSHLPSCNSLTYISSFLSHLSFVALTHSRLPLLSLSLLSFPHLFYCIVYDRTLQTAQTALGPHPTRAASLPTHVLGNRV
jgi:hypothetical protein